MVILPMRELSFRDEIMYPKLYRIILEQEL